MTLDLERENADNAVRLLMQALPRLEGSEPGTSAEKEAGLWR